MLSTSSHPLTRRPIIALIAMALLLTSQAEAVITIPSVPLQAVSSAEPNIMMVLDDSGSMQWDFLPDTINGNNVPIYFIYPSPGAVYGGSTYSSYTVDTDPTNRWTRILRSASQNQVYYDPTTTYTPWSTDTGALMPNAVPTAAFHNPVNTGAGSRNLTVNATQNATWINDNGSYTTQNRTYFPATYFNYNGGAVTAAGSYTMVQITPAAAPFPKAATRTDCIALANNCNYTEEIQNFANWYTYYRSRVLTARAGIGRAFARQGSSIRAGFGAINKGSTAIDGVNTATIIRAVRQFTGTDRTNFFNSLYNWTIPAAGTPLRRALDDVGQYYSRTGSNSPWSTTPGTNGGTELTCRQSYTILMTDGYWNGAQAGTVAAQANVDNAAGSQISGPNNPSYTYAPASPFRDNWSDTLADIAMYYWKRDLHTGLANEVPPSVDDPAFWQHMVTFGVGLGVTGTINPTAAFNAIQTGATINWPQPVQATPATLLDDLVHAAVNGRGGFFSAQNPTQFATALTDTLNAISQRSSSAASIAANSTQISTNTKVFGAKFDTSQWSGELEAYPVTSSGVGTSPTWLASSNIPAASSRAIYSTSGGSPVPFRWSNLSATDQTALGSSDVVDYLRGVRTKELQNGGTLRNRSSILGDIIDSSPVYVVDSDSIYVGANDGMLHGFNATNGVELFAYVPSAVIPQLSNLAQPTYTHTYYVDGDIAVSSTTQTPGFNYLVATLGRGGKGLFGLDVTSPASFSASNVKWEYFSAADTDLGYMMGAPVIAKMNNGTVAAIVGNGYNSTSGKAVLYIFNLATGALIKKIDTGVASDNGLASPGVFDADNDGLIDYIYAGDLKGNVWKIDVSSANPALWDFSFKSGTTPLPQFIAKDSAGTVQPITVPIVAVQNPVVSDVNYGKRFLIFGTGSYFRSGDPLDTQVQTLYGLIDQNLQIPNRAALVQRSVTANGIVNGKDVRTFSAAGTNDMANKSGWYLDLKTAAGVAEGERIITSGDIYQLAELTLIVSSIIPINDPCKPGGKGFLNALNPFTGGRLTQGFFDVTKNNSFTDDLLNGVYIGSIDLGIGMPSRGKIVGDQLIAAGSGAGNPGQYIGGLKINTGLKKTRRVSWREIIRD